MLTDLTGLVHNAPQRLSVSSKVARPTQAGRYAAMAGGHNPHSPCAVIVDPPDFISKQIGAIWVWAAGDGSWKFDTDEIGPLAKKKKTGKKKQARRTGLKHATHARKLDFRARPLTGLRAFWAGLL